MRNKTLFILSALLLLSGCANHPDPISESELATYDSPAAVMGGMKNSMRTATYDITMPKYDILGEPRLHLSQYCLEHGGQFNVRKDYGVNMMQAFTRTALKGSYGEFDCKVGNKVAWDVTIKPGKTTNTTGLTAALSGLYETKLYVDIRYAKDIEAERLKLEEEKLKQEQKIAFLEVERKKRLEKENKIYLKKQEYYKRLVLLPKSVGEQVCTIDNLFGYVEATSDDKIKVNVIGKPKHEHTYYFFESNNVHNLYSYDAAQVPLIWSQKNEWASCSFEVNL
jgi:hypothetical protein